MFICYRCKGRKVFSSLGFMEVTCLHCNGTGQTPFEKWPLINDIQSQSTLSFDVIKPKRKRKKNRKLKQLAISSHPLTLIKDKLIDANTMLDQSVINNDVFSLVNED